jgi:hypothetical protein
MLNAIHNDVSYRCYLNRQVTHVLSPDWRQGTIVTPMAETFYDALIWHMKTHRTKIADLAKGAGVSEGVIKQIRHRPGGGTGAVNGAKIAAYYGKTLDQFMRGEAQSPNDEDAFVAMVSLLTDDEREILVRQVRGMIAGRS